MDFIAHCLWRSRDDVDTGDGGGDDDDDRESGSTLPLPPRRRAFPQKDEIATSLEIPTSSITDAQHAVGTRTSVPGVQQTNVSDSECSEDMARLQALHTPEEIDRRREAEEREKRERHEIETARSPEREARSHQMVIPTLANALLRTVTETKNSHILDTLSIKATNQSVNLFRWYVLCFVTSLVRAGCRVALVCSKKDVASLKEKVLDNLIRPATRSNGRVDDPHLWMQQFQSVGTDEILMVTGGAFKEFDSANFQFQEIREFDPSMIVCTTSDTMINMNQLAILQLVSMHAHGQSNRMAQIVFISKDTVDETEMRTAFAEKLRVRRSIIHDEVL